MKADCSEADGEGTELEVEAGHKRFGVAEMNHRHSGDYESRICMDVACTVLCTMVVMAKLKNPVKTKTDAMVMGSSNENFSEKKRRELETEGADSKANDEEVWTGRGDGGL
jgi:hypothetical protein